MTQSFYTALATIAGTIITLIGSLFIGYAIFERRSREKHRVELKEKLRELDDLMARFISLSQPQKGLSQTTHPK
ncbi:hypothetical protein AKJ64_01205 [candidate division MSBL1 archaeon SCGC-AAA259E17]|uniref:Uncharacterized protein n=1 Tax=candidate division MSBL1 archaeon SCGC-AAA259E17 TaxID=1698263 RepID=A0A133UGB3_9EURY|nr:hypothetical protein AKJ64_01205 [candidate division MSBL1 archaeon SCGC-AAA259E17]